MTRNWVMATVVMMAMAGCGGEPADDSVDSIDDVTKADSSYPAGVYENAAPKIGDFYLLELNADKTFLHKTQGIDCIPNFGTCGQMIGSYKFSHSTTTTAKYIRFYDDVGNFVDRYTYTTSGDKLTLHASGSHTYSMQRNNALSGKGGSCGGFTRMPKQCAPGLICEYSHVPDVPGTCIPANPCQEAGGDCVALYPGACKGQVQDARAFSCGGGLGVECCFSN